MPIHKEGSGVQWGNHGKVYHGPHAREKAEKQAAAAHANGYRGDKSLSPGASEEEISKHIGELIDRGYEREQAVAIAYKEAGKSRNDESENDEVQTELSIAKKIRDGELSSPQQFGNLWLFAVRVTGTGTSYRSAHDEYVYRPPEKFLSDEFLERVNGLPLIFEHPEKSQVLNSEEFRNRSIGTVFLPYIDGDEVWAIAKVYDDDGAALMQATHESTSPAVVFRDAGSTESIDIDGKTVLIEGKPSLLDHLAICEAGVWDKGGDPNGVKHGDRQMNDEVKADFDKKEAEEMPAWADSLVKRLDALEEKKEERDDSEEKEEEEKAEKAGEREEEDEKKALKEGEEEHEDEEKARDDEEETEEEKRALKKAEETREDSEEEEKKERADSHKGDEVMKDKIKDLESTIERMTKPRTFEDLDALSAAQARADSTLQMFGERAVAPLHGESPIAYRKRLANKLRKHSPTLQSVRLDSLDETSFGVLEDKIYADAQAAALSPDSATPGVLIPIVRTDAAGRTITRYQGDINAWMQHFKAPGAVVKINRAQKGA